MLNLTNFNVMLAKHDYTKPMLAKLLGLNKSSLYRRIKNNGAFSQQEISKMIEVFGKEDVMNALFYKE